jgi:hypothetical protein
MIFALALIIVNLHDVETVFVAIFPAVVATVFVDDHGKVLLVADFVIRRVSISRYETVETVSEPNPTSKIEWR